MSKPDEPAIDRRAFLGAATAGGAMLSLPQEADADHHDHSHDHSDVPSDPALRVKSLESLLVAKGLVDPAAVDALVDAYSNRIGPRIGAAIVARAWTDPAFKARILDDAHAAVDELHAYGFGGQQLIALENTEAVHNVTVCTLCSCYPINVLGVPPAWYKSHAYRSRMVIEPRAVLREFGLELAEGTELRVWESNSEKRYLVLPRRPGGTDGLGADALARLVTRDGMIGVAAV